MARRFVISKLIFFLGFGMILVLIIALARGYWPDPDDGSIQPRGILVTSSTPDGAKIYINGELKGATNSDLVIRPGVYDVEIKKDGYYSWKKRLTIKGEWVIKADGLLFPQNPSLAPVTSIGVVKAMPSASTDKVILISDSGNVEKDGIYLLENSRIPFVTINPLKLLVLKSAFDQTLDFKNATISFSPEEKEILVSFPSQKDKNQSLNRVFLIPTDELTKNPFEVTPSVATLTTKWALQQQKITQKIIETYKKPLRIFAADNFDIISFSPNSEKILYQAKRDITLPIIIKPRLIATNQTEETRDLKAGDVYVYDKKEDKNFHIGSLQRDELLWYPSSQHIVMKELNRIVIIDYDGTNRRTVYAGPFEKNFLSVTGDGKLLILTNFNSEINTFPDVYTVGLK